LLRILLCCLHEGGDINEQDGDGRTILHLLANSERGDTQSSWNLLKQFSGPPITFHVGILDNDGEAALHLAAKRACSGFGLVYDDDFSTDTDSEEPLWNPVIALLETFEVPINICTAGGVTPLHLACKNGSSDFVEYLLAKDADAGAYDAMGQTALHWVCGELPKGHQNRCHIVDMLAERMALEDIETSNTDNETAYDLAIKFDAEYHERERRAVNGLPPNPNEPEGEPLLATLINLYRSIWESCSRCHSFRDIHVYFCMGLGIVKGRYAPRQA
jgi:ankyrin repeat protein